MLVLAYARSIIDAVVTQLSVLLPQFKELSFNAEDPWLNLHLYLEISLISVIIYVAFRNSYTPKTATVGTRPSAWPSCPPTAAAAALLLLATAA